MNKTCTIVFNDGETIKLSYDSQLDPMTGAALVDELMNRSTIAFEVDGKMVMYTMANIRSITIDPTPEALPKSVIRGAPIV